MGIRARPRRRPALASRLKEFAADASRRASFFPTLRAGGLTASTGFQCFLCRCGANCACAERTESAECLRQKTARRVGQKIMSSVYSLAFGRETPCLCLDIIRVLLQQHMMGASGSHDEPLSPESYARAGEIFLRL